MAREITNYEDVIDSRDVINRIEELSTELIDAPEDADDLKEELASLLELAEQCEGCGDWQWGEGLIRDSYFEDYARELAEDTGAVDRHSNWPNNCIDWEQAALELQQDYVSVDFDGVTYWIRG